jgi:hypothetical protein
MGAALVLPVSGPYTGMWNGVSLGTQNDDGFVLDGTFQGQEVNASDAWGMTLLEAIWRGVNWKMRFRSLIFNAPGILASLQAFGSTGAPSTTFTPTLANIGARYSTYSQPLVLSAILGSPPTFVQSFTAQNAIVSPQSNVSYLMTSKVREAPFEMVLLPYQATIGSLTVSLSFTTL